MCRRNCGGLVKRLLQMLHAVLSSLSICRPSPRLEWPQKWMTEGRQISSGTFCYPSAGLSRELSDDGILDDDRGWRHQFDLVTFHQSLLQSFFHQVSLYHVAPYAAGGRLDGIIGRWTTSTGGRFAHDGRIDGSRKSRRGDGRRGQNHGLMGRP